MPMETLAQAMNRLHAEGYTESFRAEKKRLRALHADRMFDPSDVRVDEIMRFEGDTDPSDMAILFAVTVPGEDLRGTWSSNYGADMNADDSAVARKLESEAD